MTWNRHQFTSADAAQLTTLLNAEFDAAKAAIGEGGGGIGFEFFGNGRVALGANSPLPHATTAPSLAVALDAGTVLRIAGTAYVLDSSVLLTGAPANFVGYCVPSVAFDEVSQQDVWSATWPTARPPLGTGTLCYLETDADSVTLLNASILRADVIQSVPVLNARLQSLESRLQVLEAGGSGDGGGTSGPAYASLLPWQPAPGDVRDTVTVILELLGALETNLRTEIADGGRRPRETIVDQIVREMAIVRQTTIQLSPDAGPRSQSANVLPTIDGIFGDGGNWPDYLETEMTLNPDGTLEA